MGQDPVGSYIRIHQVLGIRIWIRILNCHEADFLLPYKITYLKLALSSRFRSVFYCAIFVGKKQKVSFKPSRVRT